MKKTITDSRFQFLAGVINECECKQLDEAESLPTIQKIEKRRGADLPINKGRSDYKSLMITLSNGNTINITPGDLEGTYGGDASNLNSKDFIGQEWEG